MGGGGGGGKREYADAIFVEMPSDCTKKLASTMK